MYAVNSGEKALLSSKVKRNASGEGVRAPRNRVLQEQTDRITVDKDSGNRVNAIRRWVAWSSRVGAKYFLMEAPTGLTLNREMKCQFDAQVPTSLVV